MNRAVSQRVGVFNHSPNLFDRAEEASKSFQGLTTAILAAASIEALPHDLVSWFNAYEDHWKSCPKNPKNQRAGYGGACDLDFFHNCTAAERQLGSVLTRLEWKRASTERKFLAIRRVLTRKGFEEDGPTYKNFSLLVSVRNGIVHPKGGMTKSKLKAGKVNGNVDGYPAFIQQLSQQGIIEKNRDHSSWLNMLDNEKFCAWSVNAAAHFIIETLALLPDTGLSGMFKEQARLS